MADSNTRDSASSANARRLAWPGCLFVVTLVVIVATVSGVTRLQSQSLHLAVTEN